jgi:hypothetical protein
MSRFFTMFFAFFLTISTAFAHPNIASSSPTTPQPFVIADDNGGDVEEFNKWYIRLMNSHAPVKIDGWCISACTLVLMLPKEQVCVTPRASFGFHLAVTGNGPGRTPDPEMTEMLIRRFYPDIVQKWIDTRRPLTPRVVFMSFDQIVAFQIFDECK